MIQVTLNYKYLFNIQTLIKKDVQMYFQYFYIEVRPTHQSCTMFNVFKYYNIYNIYHKFITKNVMLFKYFKLHKKTYTKFVEKV